MLDFERDFCNFYLERLLDNVIEASNIPNLSPLDGPNGGFFETAYADVFV